MEAQTNDYENYKYKKEVQKEKIEMQKALNKCQTEKLHGALLEKVEREKMILEGQRDEQIVQNLKKQEKRKLKEKALTELQTHQRRIKNRQKTYVANKKLQGDIIKTNENELRDHFIKRVQ